MSSDTVFSYREEGGKIRTLWGEEAIDAARRLTVQTAVQIDPEAAPGNYTRTFSGPTRYFLDGKEISGFEVIL